MIFAQIFSLSVALQIQYEMYSIFINLSLLFNCTSINLNELIDCYVFLFELLKMLSEKTLTITVSFAKSLFALE